MQLTWFGPGIGKSGTTWITKRGVSITWTPGEAVGRLSRANLSNCDTAAMTQLSRWLARYELVRTAATWLALAVLAALAAFAFAAYYSRPTPGAIAAAVALVAVAGSGLVYAWRPGTGGQGD
jgi:hypothetical protein